MNIKFMEEAIKLARYGMNKHAGGPFGAVIVRKNKIVGKGYNKVLSTNDPTKHAEMVAISDASKNLKRFDLSDCEIYATGQPCPMCLAAIAWARIKTIYFGNDYKATSSIGFDDHDIYEKMKGNKSKIKLVIKQIDAKNSYKLYDEWIKLANKKMY